MKTLTLVLSLVALLIASPVWAQPTPITGGAGLGATQYLEDSAHASGDKGAQILCVRQDVAAQLADTDGDYAPCIVDADGRIYITATITGTVSATIPVSGNNVCTGRTVISAATTNSTNCHGNSAVAYGGYISNINAAVRYFKIYNKATAPTCGTDTPKLTLPVPGNTAGGGILLANIFGDDGLDLDTGLGFCATTGVADADTGAVAANEMTFTILFRDKP